MGVSKEQGRSYGVKDFLAKKFDTLAFDGKFEQAFGRPEKNFRMLIWGNPKNGKTEFCMQLAKYLTQHGTVYYNSFEQGLSETLQQCIQRNNMLDVSGEISFGDRTPLEVMIAKLKNRGSAKFVIIDSRDYMELSQEQYKMLVDLFPNKSFVIICWERNKHPRGEHAKAIQYMVDIAVWVKDFVAYPRSRFGGNAPYIIWDKGVKPVEVMPELAPQTAEAEQLNFFDDLETETLTTN